MKRCLDDLIAADLSRKICPPHRPAAGGQDERLPPVPGAASAGPVSQLGRGRRPRQSPAAGIGRPGRRCLPWTKSTRSASGRTGSRASWTAAPPGRCCWSPAAPSWIPGTRAAIPWPAATSPPACTPFRCGNGASSKGLIRPRPSTTSWPAVSSPNLASPSGRKTPTAGATRSSPTSSAKTWWNVPASTNQHHAPVRRTAAGAGGVAPVAGLHRPGSGRIAHHPQALPRHPAIDKGIDKGPGSESILPTHSQPPKPWCVPVER